MKNQSVPSAPCVHSVLHVHPGPSYPFLFLNQVD